MNRLSMVMLFVTACTLFLGGCSQSTAEIAETVESQVAVAVIGTVEAWPTAVLPDTPTPVPSATSQATYTPYPTYTPPPTFTPQATYTPYPTWTPTPEDTATAVPTAISVAPTTSIPTAEPTVVPIDSLAVIKEAIDSLIADINVYRSVLYETNYVSFQPVDCRTIVESYDRIMSNRSIDVGDAAPIVQSAHNSYQVAVEQFMNLTQPWTDGCRLALADGDETKTIDTVQRGALLQGIALIESNLNNALYDLNQLSE